ncbi:MAG: tetratricopeptide repeat protein [Pseudomonadota bacterium]
MIKISSYNPKIIITLSAFICAAPNVLLAQTAPKTTTDSISDSSIQTVSTSEAVDQIQKTLLFSDKDSARKKSVERKSALVIDRSDKFRKPQIDILINEPSSKANQQLEQKEKLAYNAAIAGQYEVAVELYKQILKSDPKNHHASFALAACYHKLGQYKQAKTLYYQLLKYEWDDEQTKNELIGNLIEVIVEESPNDAVYLLEKLSTQNPQSAYILAGAAMAYDKINKPDQAILLLKRAINIDPKEVKYQFNLAIIFDKIADYQNALQYYQNVIKNYVVADNLEDSIPIAQVRQRVEFIKNKI